MLPTLRRRSPIENPLDLFRRDMDLLRNDFSRLFGRQEEWEDGLTAAYPVDIREENDKVVVDAELPGFDKNDINVSVEDNVLSISAERKEEKHEGKRHLHERRYSRVERRLMLPVAVKEGEANAKFDKGVLHLEIPRTKESKMKKISIN